MTVQELNPNLQFIVDSQDVEQIRKDQGLLESEDFNAFFVDTQNGDYTEIWGMFGVVPRNDKRVYRVL